MRKFSVVLMVLALGVGIMSCVTMVEDVIDSMIDKQVPNASPEQIRGWIKSGDRAYARGSRNSYLRAVTYYNYVLQANQGKDVLTDSELVYVYTSRGVSWANLGYYGQAASNYERALEIDPDNQIAQSNLAQSQQLLAQQNAQQQQQTAVAAAPQQQVDVSGLNALADALGAMGQALQPQGGGQIAQAPSNQNTPAQSTADWQGAYNRRVQLLDGAIDSYNRMTTTTARTGQLQTIRGYQRDLRDIRSQARAAGVTITAHRLENWNP